MMKLKVFSIIIVNIFYCQNIFSQNIFEGIIFDKATDSILNNVQIFDFYDGFITESKRNGEFVFESLKDDIKLVFYKQGYDYRIIDISKQDSNFRVLLNPVFF